MSKPLTPMEEFLAKGGEIEQVTTPPRPDNGWTRMTFGKQAIEPARSDFKSSTYTPPRKHRPPRKHQRSE